MHGRYALLAVTALVLVAGCNRGAGNNSTANNSAGTNTANAAAPAASATGAAAVDRTFLVGHWGMNGDCSRTVSFNADGTGSATGETGGTWALEADTIVLSDEDSQPQRMTATRAGDNLSLTRDGQAMTMTRCPNAAVAPAGAGAAKDDSADAEEAEKSE